MVGLVVPRVDSIMRYAKLKGIEGDVKTVCTSKEIKQMIVDDFKRIGDEKKVLYFEYIPGIIISLEPFTQQNGMVTATYKLRRKDIAKKYEAQIEEVYKTVHISWGH